MKSGSDPSYRWARKLLFPLVPCHTSIGSLTIGNPHSSSFSSIVDFPAPIIPSMWNVTKWVVFVLCSLVFGVIV